MAGQVYEGDSLGERDSYVPFRDSYRLLSIDNGGTRLNRGVSNRNGGET
jgi:hypothetical protein